jgi:hypothetical protein
LAWQQKTQKNGNKVKSHLFKLYFENTPLLAKHPWEWETERWFELIFCILTEGIGIKPSLARRATNALAELKLISVPLLARDPKTDLIKEVLLQIGFSKDEANKATDAIVRISEVSKQKWNGHIQKFLRKYGEAMVDELSDGLSAALNEKGARRAATLWLQNVVNAPLLLESDSHVQQFCRKHGITPCSLVDLADELDANVSFVDDLLAVTRSK